MSRINAIPEGLLDLLGLKTLGKNPQQLEDDVQSIVDIGPLYQARSVEHFGANPTFNTPGTIAQVTVPVGEVWIPISMSGEVNVPATNERATIALEMDGFVEASESTNATVHLLAESGDRQQQTGVAGEFYGVHYQWSGTFAAKFETRFLWSITAENISGTPATLNASLLFVRLRA